MYRKYSKTPHIYPWFAAAGSEIGRAHICIYMMLNQILDWRFLIRGSLYAVLTVVISGRFQLRKLELLVYIFLIIYEKKKNIYIYIYIYIYDIFSSYLTDTFVFKLNLSILICLFPAYNYWIPLYWKCLDFLIVDVYKFAESIPSPCWKATKHKYLNNTKSEFKLLEVLIQLKKLQLLKQPRNCRN